jgi:uncharacterized protein (UPF0335 family)
MNKELLKHQLEKLERLEKERKRLMEEFLDADSYIIQILQELIKCLE